MKSRPVLATALLVFLISTAPALMVTCVEGFPVGTAGGRGTAVARAPVSHSPGFHASFGTHASFRPHGSFSAHASAIGFHSPFGPHAVKRPFFHPRPFVGRFSPFGTFATPWVYWPPSFYGPSLSYVQPSYPDAQPVYTSQVIYNAPPVYNPPPVYSPPPVYGPPAVYGPAADSMVSVAPPSPPAPEIVQFATGRYELRGDGVTTPYTWVWIPNPPSAPPDGATASGEPSPPSRSQIYRWTDEQGVLHLTDRLNAVPQRYREQAKHSS